MDRFVEGKVFSLGRMITGRLYLELTSGVSWEDFPSYAEDFINLFYGKVVTRNDSVDTRVWVVIIKDQLLRLVYEDFPVMVSLESQSEEGDKIIEELIVMPIKQIIGQAD